MAIGSTDYPHPVQVNGFLCRNCTEVDRAKKHIDPAHPRSGPYGIDAAHDPGNPKSFRGAGAKGAEAKGGDGAGGDGAGGDGAGVVDAGATDVGAAAVVSTGRVLDLLV
jgi:hypothetical protein